MKHGLTLGKYAPLHRGHQHVIETALAEMDRVTVIIYDAPETDIPLPIRANWLRHLYPQVQVIEAWGGPTNVGYSADIKKAHEDFIINTLGISGISHFYSSEPYGEHMSRALNACDRRVDEQRLTIPISATRIRANAYKCKDFIDPIVYRDLVSRIAILGAPGSGKTTLSALLANHFNTCWMPEYGREYWEQHQIARRLQPQELVTIAREHRAREDKMLLQSNRFLFCDTNALTTRLFAHDYHGQAEAELEELANQCRSTYDLTIVCDIDFPCPQTWDRSGPQKRQLFQDQILADLHSRQFPYLLVSGNIEQRQKMLAKTLQNFHKFINPALLFSS